MNREEWAMSVNGWRFTLDLLSPHFADRPCRFLEVGIFEGRSAQEAIATILTKPGSQYGGIDIWLWQDNKPIPESKAKAVQNLARIGVSELSHPGPNGWWFHGDILDLVGTRAVPRGSLDAIYIDSSHLPDQTLLESCVCFDLLAPGGFLAWDDYDLHCPTGTSNVRHGVDRFIELHCNRLEIIYKDYQCLIHKLR